MPEIIPGNGLTSTLSGAITAAATTLGIQVADAPKFPTSGTYRCVLFVDANSGPWEIVTVTGGQGTANLTVTRASEPYNGVQTALAWGVGTKIVPVMTQVAMQLITSGTAAQLYLAANCQ